MSIGKGNFHLRCDHSECDVSIDLETEDFNEALEMSKEERRDRGWTTVQRNNKYADICGLH